MCGLSQKGTFVLDIVSCGWSVLEPEEKYHDLKNGTFYNFFFLSAEV